MTPEIIAHRGASYLAPENTLSAFRKAMEIGADGVEMDVQQTSDKKLVIHHDFVIDWHTDMRGQIYDMTEGELKALDFGSWKDVNYRNERIATLQEALALCREMEGTIVQLEMKATIDDDPDFVPRVIEEVRAANITDRLVVISFNHDLLRQAKQLMPELKVGVLVYGALETMALPTSTWEMLGLQNGLEEDDFPQLPPLSVENVDDENYSKYASAASGWYEVYLKPGTYQVIDEDTVIDTIDVALGDKGPGKVCADAGLQAGLGELRISHRLPAAQHGAEAA
mgnify:CR=1 FL=1